MQSKFRANQIPGNGSSRAVKTAHAFLLMITHSTWTSWRLGETTFILQLGLEASSIYELTPTFVFHF